MKNTIQYDYLIEYKLKYLSKKQKKVFTDFLKWNGNFDIVNGNINIWHWLCLKVEDISNGILIKDIIIKKKRKIYFVIWYILFVLFLLLFIYKKYFYWWDPLNPPTNIHLIIQSGLIDTETWWIITSTDYNKYLEMKQISLVVNPVYSRFDPSDWVGNAEKVMNIRNKYSRHITSPVENITKWYVYIVASVNNWSLSDKESVYLYFGDSKWHLHKKHSLSLPPRNDWKLHLLYPLDEIIFAELPQRWYDDNKDMKPITGNWIDILNTKSSIYFFWFVSTSRQWKLEEVTIAYE
jgi:hypothetical protein